MGGRISLPRRSIVIRRRTPSYDTNDAILIGLAGQKGVGKDTFADALDSAFYEYRRHPMRLAFAEGVKMSLSQHFLVPRHFIEHWKNIDAIPPRFKMSMRKALQLIGEQMRTIQDDVWVNHLQNELRGDALVTDVRHENEVEAIRRWGGRLVLVVRHEPNDDEHISEATLKEPSKWCLENIKPMNAGGFVAMSSVQIPPDAPSLLNLIDYVVFNDTSMTALEKVAAELLEDILKDQTDYDSESAVGSMNI